MKGPLHTVYLKCDLVCGYGQLGVRKQLPVEGIALILGNDLAAGKVFPHWIVSDSPSTDAVLFKQFPSVFPACAVKRSQARKFDDELDLSDSLMVSPSDAIECKLSIEPDTSVLEPTDLAVPVPSALELCRDKLGIAQRSDCSLAHCIEAAVEKEKLPETGVGFFWDDGVLTRKWKPRCGGRLECHVPVGASNKLSRSRFDVGS